MNIISGLYNEGQIRVGIVATRFNEVVVSKLVDGAADGLSRHGVDMDLSLIHISEPTRP